MTIPVPRRSVAAPPRLCVRLLLFAVLVAACTSTRAESSNHGEPLRRAGQYLWAQQADDGGWHSPQYAAMRSGQSLTPFVLHTLLQVPEAACPRPAGGVGRALDFIRKHVDKRGALGHTDPDITEYPVYSTAYALRSFVAYLSQTATRSQREQIPICDTEDEWLVRRMANFLREAQFDEADGIEPTNLAYGGWGFDVAQKPGAPGHMDLAHTRRALEALADAEAFDNDEFTRLITFRQHRGPATEFLQVVQGHPAAANRQPLIEGFSAVTAKPPYDGGFYFSPVVLAANKGREEFKDAKYFRSYSTATCDGILALLAAGVPRDDERITRATEWLKAHDDINYPQGVPTEHPEPWGEAIRFYHYAVRAEAYAALNWPGDWREKIAAAVARHQAADGSFRNTASPLMKEDDPILCTALATIALTHCTGTDSQNTR